MSDSGTDSDAQASLQVVLDQRTTTWSQALQNSLRRTQAYPTLNRQLQSWMTKEGFKLRASEVVCDQLGSNLDDFADIIARTVVRNHVTEIIDGSLTCTPEFSFTWDKSTGTTCREGTYALLVCVDTRTGCNEHEPRAGSVWRVDYAPWTRGRWIPRRCRGGTLREVEVAKEGEICSGLGDDTDHLARMLFSAMSGGAASASASASGSVDVGGSGSEDDDSDPNANGAQNPDATAAERDLGFTGSKGPLNTHLRAGVIGKSLFMVEHLGRLLGVQKGERLGAMSSVNVRLEYEPDRETVLHDCSSGSGSVTAIVTLSLKRDDGKNIEVVHTLPFTVSDSVGSAPGVSNTAASAGRWALEADADRDEVAVRE